MAIPLHGLAAPPWVYNRLDATAGPDGARYESSFYGPVNAWLVSYFTVQNGFMCKPQPKIRPLYTPAEDDARVSLDSYDGEVLPRELGGREVDLRSPDFMIVRATDSIDNDRMVLIVEIKLGHVQFLLALNQLMDYLRGMKRKIANNPLDPLFNRDLRGMLVIGGNVYIISLNVNGSQGRVGPYNFRDGRVHGILASLAQ